MNNSFDALFERYRQTLPEKLVALEELAGRLPGVDIEVVRELRLSAHRIAGSAGSYGYPDLGDAARRVEDAINDTSTANWADPAFRARVGSQLQALRTVLERLIQERG